MRRAYVLGLILAFAAAPAAFQASSPSEADGRDLPRCGKDRRHLLADNGRAQLWFASTRDGADAVWACVRGRYRRARIRYVDLLEAPGKAEIAGRHAAVLIHSHTRVQDSLDSDRVHWYDLLARRRVLEHDLDPPPHRVTRITDVAVRATGVLAAISFFLREGPAPDKSDVWLIDRSGPRQLDHGAIDRHSLRRVGTRISWVKDGRRRYAPFE